MISLRLLDQVDSIDILFNPPPPQKKIIFKNGF